MRNPLCQPPVRAYCTKRQIVLVETGTLRGFVVPHRHSQ